MPDAVALSWAPTNAHGWGVFGSSFVREMLRTGRPRALLLAPVDPELLDAEDRAAFRPLLEDRQRLVQQTAHIPGTLILRKVCVVHALGNGLQSSEISGRYRGEPNVGFAFFERVDFPRDVLARMGWLDALIGGSSWNAELLRGLGFPRVACALQGVDTERFAPGPASGRFGDRFVIFSGGKLELRKGQDLVVAAYRRFHERHPDSLLVTVWRNHWPAIMADIAASPHVKGSPSPALPSDQAIEAWVREQGIPEAAHRDLGAVAHAGMPGLLRECHAALFPNRCEGGTNLVAMEAMASGLPCILSANSGHLDILAEDRAYPLRRQQPTRFGPPGSQAWRESDVEEILEALEAIYSDREQARRRGEAAHRFMQGLSWRRQIQELVSLLDALVGGPGA
jgi:glycosyltransferase involved in cell wall biosynthesis